MSLASPENDLERSVAAQVDSIYESGWNEALDAAAETLSKCACPTNLIHAVLALKETK